MRPLGPACSLLLLCLAAPACKDADTVAAEQKQEALQRHIAEGRTALNRDQYDLAAEEFRAAAEISPQDPMPLMLLSSAYQKSGNFPAGLLALKQASALMKFKDPQVRKQMAELEQESGNGKDAMRTLAALLEEGALTHDEVLDLARLQAREGDGEGAYKTLDYVTSRSPEDLAAKVTEVEIQLVAGDEALASKLLDQIIEKQPDLEAARVVRARHRLGNGQPEEALKDLETIKGLHSTDRDVLELKARAWSQLKRYEEADQALSALIKDKPRDADLLSLLAEVKLERSEPSEAEQLVDRALALRPNFSRALYVRGLAQEAMNDGDRAKDNYLEALRSDPHFAPALSKLWQIYQREDDTAEAISALERLLFAHDASLDEKAALAKYYIDTGANLPRGRKLIDEVMRHDPHNTRYRIIQVRYEKSGDAGARSSKGAKASNGPVIVRGQRRRH
ncbi:MAG TPA: tetratricopeptide repeat protein [Myxococcaceae bacterium]|nr:tetratricopeptide repeat protein [Myxococcaceae bacterium]